VIIASESYPRGASNVCLPDDNVKPVYGNLRSIIVICKELVLIPSDNEDLDSPKSGNSSDGSNGFDASDSYGNSEDEYIYEEDEDTSSEGGTAEIYLDQDVEIAGNTISRSNKASFLEGHSPSREWYHRNLLVDVEVEEPIPMGGSTRVTIQIPTAWMPKTTADAWKVDNTRPIFMELKMDSNSYLESSQPPDVGQVYQGGLLTLTDFK
jgi:hypothetical protein